MGELPIDANHPVCAATSQKDDSVADGLISFLSYYLIGHEILHASITLAHLLGNLISLGKTSVSVNSLVCFE